MTDRLAQIINPCWLLHAEPVHSTCAHQASARPQTAKQANPAGVAWRQSWKTCLGSSAQNVKRPTDIGAEKTGSALSP